jgi:hypothetical protein
MFTAVSRSSTVLNPVTRQFTSLSLVFCFATPQFVSHENHVICIKWSSLFWTELSNVIHHQSIVSISRKVYLECCKADALKDLAVIRSAKDEFLALMIEVELKIDESLD